MQDPIAYSVNEARAKLGIGRDNLYRLIRENQLIARKLGKRTVILAEDLAAYARALPKMGAAAAYVIPKKKRSTTN
jgi:excisionase family DNA binding protein